MDFFEHQEKARTNSQVLIFYFILAVVGIILAVYLLAVGVSHFLDESPSEYGPDFWEPGLLALTSAGTGALIFLASAYKSSQLNGGGKVVALELGGRPLDSDTTDFHERRLLNIVEEMAIASGVPVPEVYVMDSENSINAFAAGKTTSDAVIGVTRGCLKLLSRDELQGVVAHEFAHILNGDMRLNMRLIGFLFGILFLSLIGQMVLRGTYYSRGSRDRDGGGGGILIALLLIGVGLTIIGYIGMFFANLIKASISRQREYLADASAVQFTRNPDGIAGALKKIGALQEGAIISHPMAADASHLFFGSALSGQMFATHPPLAERIMRLLPSWDGNYGTVTLPPITEGDRSDKGSPRKIETPSGAAAALFSGERSLSLSPEDAAESMRSVHPEQVELAREIRTSLPDHWIEATHSEPGAQAMILALLIAQDQQLRDEELKQLRSVLDPATYDYVTRLYAEVGELHSAVKLALVDMSMPVLRKLSPGEYERFRGIMDGLVASDRFVDLFEFTLQQVIGRHLDAYFHSADPPRIRYREIGDLADAAAVLLTTLAVFSNPDDNDAVKQAFQAGSRHLEKAGSHALAFQSAEKCGLDDLRQAIHQFERGTPILKRELLLACSKTVLSDGKISSREAELVRAIADAMGCPIPPFLKTAPLG